MRWPKLLRDPGIRIILLKNLPRNMKSPFPGMDPYLEQHWGDVHLNLISFAEGLLNEHLPRDLRARAQERILVELPSEDRVYYPDVRVVEHERRGQGGTAVAIAGVP